MIDVKCLHLYFHPCIYTFLFAVGTVGEPSYMDLSNMPVDNKQQQTMMWQQNQYMSDSGIHSGQTTQVRFFSVEWCYL